MTPWIKISLKFLAAFLIAWLVWRLLLFQVSIPSPNINDAFMEGDRVLVSRTSYGLRLPGEALFGLRRTSDVLPERGDFLAFNDPLSNERNVSSRPICIGKCIALPGDTVWFSWNPNPLKAQDQQKKYPFVIPRKNTPIDVQPWNMNLLANALHLHENKNVCWNCSHVLVVDGQPQKQIRFSQDYVWILNSGAQETYDSRLFGLLPSSHIIGRLMCISYSKDPTVSFLRSLRCKRSFTPITE